MSDAGHRVPLLPGWSLWREGALRMAGFPFALLERLHTPGANEDALRPAWARASTQLREVFASGPLRTALAWQNAEGLRRMFAHLDHVAPGATDSATRNAERTLTNYLARYVAKNDTVGHFGPFAWIAVSERPEPLPRDDERPLRVTRRRTFVEGWALERLAQAWSRRPGIRAALAPARSASVHEVEGGLLDGQQLVTVEPAAAVLWRAADGTRAASALCADAARAGVCARPEDAAALLEQLAERGLLVWSLVAVPDATCAFPALAEALSALPVTADRDAALAEHAELEAIRGALDEALDAASVLALNTRLDALFARVTGGEATRNAGQFYAGRTVAYQDCTAESALTLGAGFFEPGLHGLAVVLDAARWFTAEVVVRFRSALDSTLALSDGEACDYATMLERAMPVLTQFGQQDGAVGQGFLDDAVAELDRRWAALLEVGALEGGALRLEGARARAAAEQLFPPQYVGGNGVWYSPDLQVLAADRLAIARGEHQLVLGEVHLAVNTLMAGLFMAMHPDRASLERRAALDSPPSLEFAPSLDGLRKTNSSFRAGDHQILDGYPIGSGPPSTWLRPAELVVRRSDGALWLCTRDGQRRWPLLDALWVLICAQCNERWRILPPRSHQPRVSIDGLVVARASWAFTAAELEFARADTVWARALGAREWRAARGLPRYVFAKSDRSPKPFCVDLESAHSIEALAHTVRQATRVSFKEMLPGPEHLWLETPAGRVTAEFRLVAVDTSRDAKA